MTTRRARGFSTKLAVYQRIITRMVLATQDWPIENVYHGEFMDPEGDEHMVIALLEEFRDVWKPKKDATPEDNGPPTERSV